jgi:putative ABC transport system permease protein
MNLFRLSGAYLRANPLNTLLNLLLLALGMGTIVVLLLFSQQLQEKLLRDARGIDLVVGAKGSPLQLILSSIYHVDTPTGNIPLSEAEELMAHKWVKSAIPLALGDNYQGYRIVGTTLAYPAHYQAQLAQGRFCEKPLEATLGAEVARETGLQMGAQFIGAHGLTGGFGENLHDEHQYTVTGILKPTGTVMDRLILTNIETVWAVHEVEHENHGHAESEEHEVHENEAHTDEEVEHENHAESEEHEVHENEAHTDEEVEHENHAESEEDEVHGNEGHTDEENAHDDQAITALLIKYQSPLAAVSFPRTVNSRHALQAASPAFETARLLKLLGFGLDTLRAFGILLIITATLSMFIALYHSLAERRYDLAIMRTLGASKIRLLWQLLFEGILIALLGTVLGLLLGHLVTEILGVWLNQTQQLYLTGWTYVTQEYQLLLLAILIGSVSALLPAIQAYRTDIAKTLSSF